MGHETPGFTSPDGLAETTIAAGAEPQSGPRLRAAGSPESKTEQRELLGESVANFLASFISDGEDLSAKEQRRAMVEDLRALLFEDAETVTLDERANGGLYLALQEGVLKKDQTSIVAVANYINNLVMLRMMSERR